MPSMLMLMFLLNGQPVSAESAKPLEQPRTESYCVAAPKESFVTVKTSKSSFKSGETVTFTITATNPTDKEMTLRFNSGQSFDVSVSRADTTADPVWTWSKDRMFTMALHDVALAAGESKSWSAEWNQKTDAGEVAPRGSYQARVWLTTSSVDGKSVPISFNLTE